MEHLPHDPAILVSSINMLLRDEEFDSLESLCYNFNVEPENIKSYLLENGFVFSSEQLQFRPVGYNTGTSGIPQRSSINIAYAFLHQKRQVYLHSTVNRQRDDIEVAVADYINQINPQLYKWLAGGRTDFLQNHECFLDDINQAVAQLDAVIS